MMWLISPLSGGKWLVATKMLGTQDIWEHYILVHCIVVSLCVRSYTTFTRHDINRLHYDMRKPLSPYCFACCDSGARWLIDGWLIADATTATHNSFNTLKLNVCYTLVITYYQSHKFSAIFGTMETSKEAGGLQSHFSFTFIYNNE